jgi:hypothetical protein
MKMSAETKKILELLAEGKISKDDAERLLDKLSSSAAGETSQKDKAAEGGPAVATPKPRVMRIIVERPGHEQVNIRMPLALTRSGANIMAVLPFGVMQKLSDLGIDVANLNSMSGAIEDMHIDVDKGNGKRVQIFCE